jgi:tRNA-dependent cyclodipeptide synthase
VISASNSNRRIAPPVSIVKILPEVPAEEVFRHRRCYLGISLENPLFEGWCLRALCDWIAGRFDRCLVIVGDYLCRYNECIFTGSDMTRAAEAALELGEKFLAKNRPVLDRYPGGRFHLTRWRDHLRSRQFKDAAAALERLFESEPDFRRSVEKDAFAYINRKSRHGLFATVDVNEAAAMSCRYLLEEIAVFSAVSRQGWQVEVYPGPELTTLEQVANGRYEGVPQGLKSRINVEVEISRGERQRE